MRRFSWPAFRGFLITFVFTLATCIGWLVFIRIAEGADEEEDEEKEVEAPEEEVDAASSSEGEGHEGGGEGGSESHEGGEGGEGEGEEGGEEGIAPISQITAAVVIILILIIVTILFEKAKEAIEKMADKVTKPAIQSLFGEMTVLGFLSVTTFLLAQLGVFGAISEELFGEEEWLEELFEKIHYVLFFVMCSFLAQVLRILDLSKMTFEEWKTFEALSQDEEHMEPILQTPPEDRKHSENELVLYYHLRNEFIINRSVEPPFAPSSKPLPDCFDFSAYLYHNLGEACCEIVEVEVSTWVFFIVCTLLFYCIGLAVHSDLDVMKWVWLGAGWLGMLIAVAYSYYLDGVKRAYAPADTVAKTEYLVKSSVTQSQIKKTTPEQPVTVSSTKKSTPPHALPRWCQIDLDRYLAKRGCLTKKISPHHEPTRQDALYYFEREGHEYNLKAFQIGIISVDIYLAILVVLFASHVHSHTEAIFFLLLGIAPFMTVIGNSRRQMRDLAIAGSMGSFRNEKLVAKVIREWKTATAVLSFLVLEKMHRLAKEGFRTTTDGGSSGEIAKKESIRPVEMEEAEREMVARTFDAVDHDGSGQISHEELGTMLRTFGCEDGTAAKALIASLDDDNNGYVTKEEFIQWYSKHMVNEDGVTLQEKAHNLFHIFDKNGDGEIGLEEFQIALDAFHMGFSIDEIGMIVTELNEDGGISVGLEQFEDMMERFYPDEIGNTTKSKNTVTTRKPTPAPKKLIDAETDAIMEASSRLEAMTMVEC